MSQRNRLPSPLFALCVLTLGAASALQGQSTTSDYYVHPNQQRGFSAETAYEIGQLDNINLFNGNLTLTLPIGPRLPVSSNFSWGLTLTYNSKAWDFERDDAQTNCASETGGPRDDRFQTYARPAVDYNAGLGWMLNPGHLYRPLLAPFSESASYLFLGPDGGLRTFPTNGVAFTESKTTDGSYLRLKNNPTGASSLVYDEVDGPGIPDPQDTDTYLLEFPDGTVQTFDSLGRTIRIQHLTGAGVTVTPPVWDGSFYIWLFEDDEGHQTKLSLRTGSVAGRFLIDHADLPGATKADGTAQNLRFKFLYQEGVTIPALPREVLCDLADGQKTIDLLTGIRVHEVLNGTEGAELLRYDFTYSGWRISSMTVPTGGRLEWDFDTITFPTPGERGHTTNLLPLWTADSETVVEKRRVDPLGGTTGTWQYGHGLNGQYLTTEQKPAEKWTRVTGPDGVVSFNFFSTEFDWTYGLPFTKRVSDPASAGRFLSSMTVDATRAPGYVHEDPISLPTEPLMEAFVAYESDNLRTDEIPDNQRLRDQRTYYYERHRPRSETCQDPARDGTSHWSQTLRSSYIGFGRYKTIRRDGSLDPEDEQTTRLTFAKGSTIGSTEAWLPGLVTSQEVEDEQGTVNRVETCYDESTGLPLRQRTLKSENGSVDSQGKDVLVAYEYFGSGEANGVGNLKAERVYGGDDSPIVVGSNLCTGSLGTPSFVTRHDYSNGVRSQSRLVEPGNETKTLVLLEDLTIDPASGSVLKARDGSGVETAYEYDALGRMTHIDPAEDADFHFVYAPRSGGTKARVDLRRGSLTSSLLFSRLYFDGLGRVVEERNLLPSGWAQRKTTYDSAGRKLQESGFQDFGSTPVNTTYEYNGLGRLCKVTGADGSVVRSSYQGLESTKQFASVRGAGNIERILVTDTLGQLQTVHENSGADGSDVRTHYDYDAGGRLEKVSIETALGPEQLRKFDYDGRGFLKRECHPEKGYLGNIATGCVEYGGFDALGRPSSRQDGEYSLGFKYDGASRLTQVTDTTKNRPLKEYFYYPPRSGSGLDLNASKLYQAKRHNYLPVLVKNANAVSVTLPGGQVADVDYPVTETFTYQGPEGRLSSRRTVVTDISGGFGGARPFEQSFSYDSLGNLLAQAYPHCQGDLCQSIEPARTVQNTYTRGLLKSISGYANSVTYHGNGALASVVHSNGTTDETDRDPNWLTRPAELRTLGPGGGTQWNSGAYSYDGSGNIQSIGQDQYFYDEVSRLTQAQVWNGGAQTAEEYTYDRFGSMTSIGLAGQPPRTYPVNQRMNRIEESGPSGPLWRYDSAGNLLSNGGIGTFTYDALGMVTNASGMAGKNEYYLYTASDERILQMNQAQDTQSPRFEWTLRGLDAKVLRSSQSSGTSTKGLFSWNWKQDYIYRGSSLLATEKPTGTEHFHLDHLGTPRLKTSATGAVLESHKYLPYGEELTTPGLEVMQFTSHERDIDPSGSGMDLDYMHARYYSNRMGRFLSLDSVLGTPEAPQSWNRYGYSLGNPVWLVDPDGNWPRPATYEEIRDKNLLVDALSIWVGEVADDGGLIAAVGLAYPLSVLGRTVLEVGTIEGDTDIALTAMALAGGMRAPGVVSKAGESTLAATQAGESSTEAIATTAHGAERIAGAGATRGGVLSAEQITAVRSTGRSLTQADGASVRVLSNEAGRFNVVVDGESGLITTFENLSQKSLDRLARNYGWREAPQ